MPLPQTQSIGNWTAIDFNETIHATERFGQSTYLDDKDLRHSLARTQASLLGPGAADATTAFGTTNGGNGGPSLTLRNKLSHPAHQRVTAQLNHEKNQLGQNVMKMKKETKSLRQESNQSKAELGALRNRQKMLMNSLESDRAELALLEAQLANFDQMNATGAVGESQRKIVAGHGHGMAILAKEFGYNPVYKKPGATFSASSSFQPRIKFGN